MPEYELRWSKAASKELDRLHPQVEARVVERIDQLAITPRPPGSLRLKGETAFWRIRVGDYRVLYAIDDAERIVSVLYIRHRKDVYRDL
jgi:mRNA interferase RelE/StbE